MRGRKGNREVAGGPGGEMRGLKRTNGGFKEGRVAEAGNLVYSKGGSGGSARGLQLWRLKSCSVLLLRLLVGKRHENWLRRLRMMQCSAVVADSPPPYNFEECNVYLDMGRKALAAAFSFLFHWQDPSRTQARVLSLLLFCPKPEARVPEVVTVTVLANLKPEPA